MKKIALTLLLMLFLCGCEKTGPEYLISSMGFDSTKGVYNVCFEAVIINTETTEQSVRLLKGSGNTVEDAVKEIDAQITQPLMLSHCGVIAIGNSINNKQLHEIGEFCYSRDEITLSAFFVRTENALQLLSVKPVSSVCAGYDIMGLIEQNKPYKNRFFEIINSDYEAALPQISLMDGGLCFDKAS